MLYTILGIIAAVIALILISAAFLSSEFTITKNTIIAKPKQFVYDYIKFLKNSDHFNKWVMMDPNLKKEYKGTDATVGFIYAWDSENKGVGKGEQEITALKDGERIDYQIRFQKPFEATSDAWFILEDANTNQTKVSWTFRGTRNYMSKLMHLILNLKKMLGKDLQTSLDRLKSELEKA